MTTGPLRLSPKRLAKTMRLIHDVERRREKERIRVERMELIVERIRQMNHAMRAVSVPPKKEDGGELTANGILSPPPENAPSASAV